MTRLLLLLLLAACIDKGDDDSSADAPCVGAGCPDDCERASDIVVLRYRECGISVESSDDEFECTEALGVQSLCIAACIDDAPCAAIDGTDSDASLVLVDCYTDCV